MRVWLVEFLNSENAIPGDYYITPDGSIYRAVGNDQLGGIGSIFKKIGEIAGNVGGALIGMPGAGTALLGGSKSKTNQIEVIRQTVIQASDEVTQANQTLSNLIDAGQIDTQAALDRVDEIIRAYHTQIYFNREMNPTEEITALIRSYEAQFEPQWDSMRTRAKAKQKIVVNLNGSTNQSEGGGLWGFSYQQIALGAAGLGAAFLILRQR